MSIVKSKPNKGLGGKNILLYGAPGTCKSTAAASFDGAVFVATEAGLDELACARWQAPDGRYVVATWSELRSAVEEVAKDPSCKTIVIDTIDNATDLAFDHICKNAGTEWIGDGSLGYGKGNGLLFREVKNMVNWLSRLPQGVIFTSHVQDETQSTRTGEITRWVPSVRDDKAGKVRRALTSQMNLICYIGHNKDDLEIHVKGSLYHEAKDRIGLDFAKAIVTYDDMRNFEKYLTAHIAK